MKTVIVGAGALGSLFAYFLARSNKPVAILDKYPHEAEIINKNGLKVEGISGEHQLRVKASAEPGDLGEPDLVLVCVKSADTASAAQATLPILKPDTVVLTVQNGLGNVERIAEVVGVERAMGGTTAVGATLLAPGHIRHAGDGETIIGETSGEITNRAKAIRDHLESCGLKASITDNLESLVWSKLVINVGINALTALTRMKNGELVNYEGARTVLAAAVEEAVHVVKEKGIRLLYDNPVDKVESVCRATAGNISSMLQDVIRQRRTEVAYINGAIVREAKRLGLTAPINETLDRLVRTLEESYAKQIIK